MFCTWFENIEKPMVFQGLQAKTIEKTCFSHSGPRKHNVFEWLWNNNILKPIVLLIQHKNTAIYIGSRCRWAKNIISYIVFYIWCSEIFFMWFSANRNWPHRPFLTRRSEKWKWKIGVWGPKMGFRNVSSKQSWSSGYGYLYSELKNIESYPKTPKMTKQISIFF